MYLELGCESYEMPAQQQQTITHYWNFVEKRIKLDFDLYYK